MYQIHDIQLLEIMVSLILFLQIKSFSFIFFVCIGVRMPLGKLIPNPEPMQYRYGLNYNEYIVYDESQIAIRYLVQFRR